jgi:hypothetical protein
VAFAEQGSLFLSFVTRRFMSTGTQFNLNELYKSALEQFESALKTGAKIQEESIKLFTTWANEPPLMQAQKAQSALLETMSSIPDRFQDGIRMMNDQAKNAMDMLHQAFEMGRSTNLVEAQEKTHQLWETTLGVIRTNVHSMLRSHATLMEQWAKMAGAASNGHVAPSQSAPTT